MKNISTVVVRSAEDGQDFLGIRISNENDRDTEIVTPRYYMPDMKKPAEKLTKEERQKLKQLVRAWKKYQSRKKTKNNGEIENDGVNYDFDAAFSLVQDFVDYGLYIELEKLEARRTCGKIDFSKTIKKCRPILLDEGPLYLPYITNVKKVADESLVRDTQILVLNDIARKIGWLIGFNIYIPQHGVNSSRNKSLISRLKMIKGGSYNSRKLLLIDNLIQYLSAEMSSSKDNNDLFVSVVYEFWEDIVSVILGNVDKSELDKYFYIRHRYSDKKTGAFYKIKRELNPLKPDAVYKDDIKKHLIIFDAKYYDKKVLPNNYDITKQFAYMRKAYGYYGGGYEYRNIFILPTDDCSHFSNRIAYFDPDVPPVDDLLPIEVIYINVYKAVELYLETKNVSAAVLTAIGSKIVI